MNHKLFYFLIILVLASTNSISQNSERNSIDSLSKFTLHLDARFDSLQKTITKLQESSSTLLKKQNELDNNLKILEDHSALIINFIISIPSGIIAGIVASLIWLLLQKWNHKKKLKKICKPLVGIYNVLNITNEKIEVARKVSISYISGNILETKGFSSDSGQWKGRIVIDENSPDWGSGFYRYYENGPQGNENGLHRVIIDRENNRLYVNIETFTHDIQKTKAMIWQKNNHV